MENIIPAQTFVVIPSERTQRPAIPSKIVLRVPRFRFHSQLFSLGLEHHWLVIELSSSVRSAMNVNRSVLGWLLDAQEASGFLSRC